MIYSNNSLKKMGVYFISTILVFSAFISTPQKAFSDVKTIDNTTLYSITALKQKAEDSINKKDFNKALFYLGKLLAKYPNDFAIRTNYAYSLYMTKKYDNAINEFNYVIKKSTDYNLIEYSKQIIPIIEKEKKEYEKNKNKVLVSVTNKNKNLQTKGEVIEVNKRSKNHYFCEKDNSLSPKGKFFRWEKNDYPIKVFVPQPPEKFGAKNNDKYVSLIKNAFAEWTKKAPEIANFQFVSYEDEANIVIKWIEFFKDESTWGQAHFPLYNSVLKKRSSLIYLAVKAQPGSANYSLDSVLFGDDELKYLTIHELGHALGLGHSEVMGDLMFPFVPSAIIPGLKQEFISQRDVETINLLYSFPENSTVICK